jgi:hypothetical protein
MPWHLPGSRADAASARAAQVAAAIDATAMAIAHLGIRIPLCVIDPFLLLSANP